MKAIVNTSPGRIELVELPVPEPGPGQVRVKTSAFAICATDLEMIAGWQRTGFPAIPGHEWCGTIDSVGDGVSTILAGKMCVAENVLCSGGEIGFEHPGAYAQYFLTDAANVYPLPPETDPLVATLSEPLAVSLRGLRRLRMDARRNVLIFGDGPIGLIMLMLAARNGAEDITLIGGRTARLAMARESGACRTMNYHDFPDISAAQFAREINGKYANIIEASGSAFAVETALEAATRGARILIIGDYAHAIARFPWNHILHKEIELIGSNTGSGAWSEAVNMIKDGVIPLHKLITNVFAAEQYEKAFECVREDRNAIKVVLYWSPLPG